MASSSSNKNIIDTIRSSLSTFQRTCTTLKDKITEFRKRKISPAEKNQLDSLLKDTKSQEQSLKSQFETGFKEQDSKPDIQRATLQKLFKDYERLKISLDALTNEAQLITVSAAVSSNDNFARTGNNDDFSQGQKQQIVFKPILQETDIDEIMLDERADEIKKLNEDLILVNDMFKNMAEIVGKQGEQVDRVHKATESSHEQAKEGLEQVNQAANYQPTCVLC